MGYRREGRILTTVTLSTQPILQTGNFSICLPSNPIVKGHDKFPEADLFFEEEIIFDFIKFASVLCLEQERCSIIRIFWVAPGTI